MRSVVVLCCFVCVLLVALCGCRSCDEDRADGCTRTTVDADDDDAWFWLYTYSLTVNQ